MKHCKHLIFNIGEGVKSSTLEFTSLRDTVMRTCFQDTVVITITSFNKLIYCYFSCLPHCCLFVAHLGFSSYSYLERQNRKLAS